MYNPGLSILWGSQNGSYVGAEAIVVRSSTSPASEASSLQGYSGTLTVPSAGGTSTTVAIGTTVNVPASDTTPGYTFVNQLFNGLEPQGGVTTGNAVDCVNTNLCQIQQNNGGLVLVLPNSIFVLAPAAASADGTANYTVQTIALLNTQVLNVTQDLQNVIAVVSAQ